MDQNLGSYECVFNSIRCSINPEISEDVNASSVCLRYFGDPPWLLQTSKKVTTSSTKKGTGDPVWAEAEMPALLLRTRDADTHMISSCHVHIAVVDGDIVGDKVTMLGSVCLPLGRAMKVQTPSRSHAKYSSFV